MTHARPMLVLGIESSCDDTAAAVLANGRELSNVTASQSVHARWGGVVPELASRAHQEHIVPTVHEALRQAGIEPHEIDAVAFTQGPGLIGALLVGACFARSFAQALGKPLIGVNHMQAHVSAHFIRDERDADPPRFPFINLTVSGGHTQLVLVRSALEMEVIGTTLDDAAGEAFDKGAKILGLPYPGGPLIDQHARHGDPSRFALPEPAIPGLDMSFSGIKTAFANLVRSSTAKDPDFIAGELPHLCASLQNRIVRSLLGKLRKAALAHDVKGIDLAGGVSANSCLRLEAAALADREGWRIHVPPLAYCTDNAAMIAMAGDLLYRAGHRTALDAVPFAR